jgi:hypothetical protein
MTPKISSAVLYAVLLVACPTASAGVIANSAHDFTGTGAGGSTWNIAGTSQQICAVCHTPHKADTATTAAALWNHANTAQTYTLYSSTTLKATVAQPGATSKLCLSCHDGTVAVDSFGGNTGTHTIASSSRRNLGGAALNDDHPIGFTYDTALVTANGSLHDTSFPVTIGTSPTKTGTISNLLLYGGKMECSSCHDVHNTFAVGPNGSGMVKLATAGSVICLACHNK